VAPGVLPPAAGYDGAPLVAAIEIALPIIIAAVCPSARRAEAEPEDAPPEPSAAPAAAAYAFAPPSTARAGKPAGGRGREGEREGRRVRVGVGGGKKSQGGINRRGVQREARITWGEKGGWRGGLGKK
jgi:hypothetical protein